MAERMAGAQFTPLRFSGPDEMKQKRLRTERIVSREIHLKKTVNWFFETIYLGERIGMADEEAVTRAR